MQQEPPQCEQKPVLNSDYIDNLKLAQLDGNISMCSSENSTAGVTIRDKATCALNLPSIATYNMRSVFPKISNLKDNILERSIDCAFLVEIWQKKEKK